MIFGLGVAPTQTGGSTWAMCSILPIPVAMSIAACRDSYANTGADLYDYAQYGGSAPAPSGVLIAGGTKTPEEIAEANRRLIEAAEKGGYHPGQPSFPGLTASDLQKDFDDAVSLTPWLIAAAVVIGVVVLQR